VNLAGVERKGIQKKSQKSRQKTVDIVKKRKSNEGVLLRDGGISASQAAFLRYREERERKRAVLRQPPRAARRVLQLGTLHASDEVPYFVQSTYRPEKESVAPAKERFAQSVVENARTFFGRIAAVTGGKITACGRAAAGALATKRFAYGVATLAATLAVPAYAMELFRDGMKMKGEVLGVGQTGVESLQRAASHIKDRRFDQSTADFEKAEESFAEASRALDEWNSIVVDASKFFPVVSKLSSGKYALEAGRHIALAGASLNGTLAMLASIKNPLDSTMEISLLDVFRKTEQSVDEAKRELMMAKEALDEVKIEDLPEDKRERFLDVKTHVPTVIETMNGFSDSSHILTEVLGGNGPRKYLFLFQNNHEMRATGGFIGSYGLLDISNGRVRTFFVDGIFNPDGQLRENVVPPKPIQKMSAAWSLHDSNWFPDFPTSAEKAISFYEKTGGPTVDGVMTLTPEVMQKLLRVTGSIELQSYGKTLDADNFVAEVQQQVEADYDKKENKPKQILADLAPILLDRLLNVSDAKRAITTIEALESGLGEKHILLYSRNAEIERIIDEAGWSGRILDAKKDYLSVINTNINGYKTDGVIEESIDHRADIQDDGSIIDTVTVTRSHRGGHTDKEWWNKVNADYMRVYVPQGSQLLSAEGQTRETIESPLDYDRLGFRRDRDVEEEERSMTIDPQSGTRIYREAGKTVFANWVYVSPQESVTVTYRYLLPFTIDTRSVEKDGFDSYGLILQKQSGSVGSGLTASVAFSPKLRSVWQSSENLVPYDGDETLPDSRSGLRFEGNLARDRFLGVVFGGMH
jgi:hypothetical protein